MSLVAGLELLPLLSTIFQMVTACIAVLIGMVTLRYTRQQSALTLSSHNNAFANTVNTTLITSADARAAFARLQDTILGSPDDAVVFMYLNYVHNTFRMRAIGVVSGHIWTDTLAACVAKLGRLTRDQVEQFLARGYEPAFRTAVLAGLDQATPAARVVQLTPRLAA